MSEHRVGDVVMVRGIRGPAMVIVDLFSDTTSGVEKAATLFFNDGNNAIQAAYPTAILESDPPEQEPEQPSDGGPVRIGLEAFLKLAERVGAIEERLDDLDKGIEFIIPEGQEGGLRCQLKPRPCPTCGDPQSPGESCIRTTCVLLAKGGR